MVFKNYIDPTENEQANRKLPRLMFEGLLLGGTGLGVLALIFEIAADAFSVAAYQTLLAIHGAEGHHSIAVLAFTALSIMLFLGIVPAYKAGAYLRPNAGGSGPLVEAIGPPRMKWLSWIGTSLFFLDAILTIIISSISAADVTMLIFPEWAAYRILLAEFFAFFIMSVLVMVGPKRAVPLFLIGGGAFTIFTIVALSIVGASAMGNPDWAFLTEGIVYRLEESGVVEHVVRATEDVSVLSTVVFVQLFFRSMSSAMLGFSGYEVIPASGKHAARPKWKVINTALTLAAVFLIGTGVVQLTSAQRWDIPSTEGYSTLLIEYEIVAVQTFSGGIDPSEITVTEADLAAAETFVAEQESHGEEVHRTPQEIAQQAATARLIDERIGSTSGAVILTVAGALLAIILLLAQGGGYVGGAAVAANAARLGRLPEFFSDDRIGIIVIWAAAAVTIPIIREVVIVEAYYAFGFVSAFIITSTTVYLVRDDVLRDRKIEPGSAEARSLKFAGLRGMIASYIMGVVLIFTKTDALSAIIFFGALITLIQIMVARGGLQRDLSKQELLDLPSGSVPDYQSGIQRSKDMARQRGFVDVVNHLIEEGRFYKFNIEPRRIRRLASYLYNIDSDVWDHNQEHHGDHVPEPSTELEVIYQDCRCNDDEIARDIEHWSHVGIFTFILNYHQNWVAPEHGRDTETVVKSMLSILFPLTPLEEVWEEYQAFEWQKLPEGIWQFTRLRYQWAKDQWPNLSDRITTIWTLQEFGLLPAELDFKTMISVNDAPDDVRSVQLSTHAPESDDDVEEPESDDDLGDDE